MDDCRLLIFCLLSWVITTLPCPADEPQPIYEQEPYDQITLSDEFENQTFKIYPVELPADRQPNSLLRVRLQDLPDRYYDVAWKDIQRVDKFPEMVLAEANRLVKAKQFDLAFWHFDFLRKEYPDVRGLDQAIANFLIQDAGMAYRQKAYAEALSLLDEANRADPSRKQAVSAAVTVATKMFEKYVADADYVAARSMLSWATKRFGRETISATVQAWEQLLASKAQRNSKPPARPFGLVRIVRLTTNHTSALRVWPELPGLEDFASQVALAYPVVKVGVTRPARDMDPRRAEDWAARRTGRLRHRTLVEMRGYGPDGGEYFCPLGDIQVTPDSREIDIRLQPNDAIASLFTGYDVANVLLEMARPGGPDEVPLWSQLAGRISVTDVYAVKVQLTQPVLRPEALLQTPLSEIGRDGGTTAGPTNPYVVDVDGSTAKELRLIRNEQYAARQATQPMEIIEHYYDDPTDLVADLRQGKIEAADRLFPADVETLQRADNVEVRQYAVPSIHFLVPNFKQPLMQLRTFRRALTYGISRQTILEQDLLAKSQIRGCQLISGPFPAGISSDDPLGYAYDQRIKPRGYEPTLALTLAEVGRGELRAKTAKSGEPVPETKPLLLVHAAAAVPRIASAAIAQYLTAIQIPCETKELRPGQTIPQDDDWDLLYMDMIFTEPMFDIRRLLGAEGLIAGGSSYLELALRRLGLATNWEQSRETLHDIHRLAHEEVAVVPLWQLTEFFAFQPRLQEVGDFPLSLYQHVEGWKLR